MPFIIIGDSFKNKEIEKNGKILLKSNLEITSSYDSLKIEIQAITTSNDKITTITSKVSSNVEGTTPKTYLVTSFIIKLKE